MKRVKSVRIMEKSKITLGEVKDTILELRKVLYLVEETEENSLKVFIEDFSKMDVPQASMIVQDVIASEGYLIDFAKSQLKEMAPRFPSRTEEEVEEKLMRVESIRVAVAILILIKNSSKQYIDWYFETIKDYINENNFLALQDRLDAIVNYIEKGLIDTEKLNRGK